ncbi:MAG: ABC transporter substrate-binding protein, partial [Motiliproteus sp.]|nr:ABC transporter substrate-binding protein [Motiliproteus sp.]
MPQSTGPFQHRLLRLSGVLLAALLMLITPNLQADQQGALPSIRVAALKFGTLNWELDTMIHQEFDRNNGFHLNPLNLATVTATRTALLSGNSDVIVADWLWVSRQRDRGLPLQFIPYSTSIGKLMLAKNSPIQELEDLRGKRIGIAGGPVDKGWLLLQAWA